MEYVNKQTGEVYQAEEVDLKNSCDGDLNFLFTGEFRKLINELDIGDKGNITINIKASKSLDTTGDEAIFVEAQLGTKYPKAVISDNNAKKVAENGQVVQKIESGMFDEAAEGAGK